MNNFHSGVLARCFTYYMDRLKVKDRMGQPQQDQSLSSQVDALLKEKAVLESELLEKGFIISSRPTIRWGYLFRKCRNIFLYCVRSTGRRLSLIDAAPLTQEAEFEQRHEIHRLKEQVRRRQVQSLRLSAELLEESFFSIFRLKVQWGKDWRFFKQIVFSLFAAKYEQRLGHLRQYEPRRLRISIPLAPPVSRPPTIQMVIPSFQQGKFLERTIRSVVDQDYPALRLRVYDGGSTDGSVSTILKFADRLAGWISGPDGGQSQAIRNGFRHHDGEIMAYLNSDDMLLPGALAYVGSFFSRNPQVDVVYSHRIMIDEEDREIGRWVVPRHDSEVLRWADYIPQETMFWRRELYDRVGGIDPTFKFAMDWDLILRFQTAGANFVRLPVFLGAFRIHASQKTSEILNSVGIHEMNRIREREHLRPVSHAEVAYHTKQYLLRSALLSRWLRLTAWIADLGRSKNEPVRSERKASSLTPGPLT